MGIGLSYFEDSFIVEFLFFLWIVFDLLDFFIVGSDLSWYSLELVDRLFGDNKLSDNLFDMIIKVVLFVGGRFYSLKRVSDGGHLNWMDFKIRSYTILIFDNYLILFIIMSYFSKFYIIKCRKLKDFICQRNLLMVHLLLFLILVVY